MMNRSIALTLCLLLLTATATYADTVAWWRFEEGPADAQVSHGADNGVYDPAVIDHSGNGYELSAWTAEEWAGHVYREDVPFDFVPATQLVNNFSVKNSGGSPGMFTSSSDWISTSFSPAQWSVQASFKCENGSNRTLVGRDSQGANAESPNLAAFYLQILGNDAVAVAFCDVDGYWHNTASEPGIVQGFNFGENPNGDGIPWYTLIGASDGETLSLFLKNETEGGPFQLVAQTDLLVDGSTNTALTLGAGDGGDWDPGVWSVGRGLWSGGHVDRAYGYIDEVRISDHAFTTRRAWNPSPALDQVEPQVTFTWNTALDAAGNSNARAVTHQLYLQASPTDPNWASPIDLPVSGPTASYGPVNLGYDVQEYRWRVDTVVNDPDPNTLAGPVWTFSTRPSIPVLTTQPQDVLVAPGDDATFTVAADSVSNMNYQWKKVNPDGDDINIGANSDTLTLAAVTDADEGYYYCEITNDSGTIVNSEPAALAVERIVAHWPFDNSYIDASGNGHDADPNGAPTYIQGVDGTANGAAVMSGDGWANAGAWNPSELSNQLTVTFWLRWDGTNGTWQTFVTKRTGGFSTENVLWQVSADNNAPHLWFQTPRSNLAADNILIPDAWQHVAATYDGQTARLYFNGELQGTDDAWQFGDGIDSPIIIGAAEELGGARCNGALDDVRIYNHALSDVEVARLYSNATGQSVCVDSERPEAAYDYDGNCVVDLADFATFIEGWLECGLLPDCLE